MEDAQDTDRELVIVKIQIRIGGETIRLDIPVPAGPATWDDLLPFMRALAQLTTEMGQEKIAAEGRSISCRAGCGICCRQIVPIAEFEAHRLARLVESMPEPRRSTILERFDEATRRFEEAELLETLDHKRDFDPDGVMELAARYFRLMVACPFLEDESCSIYEERPISCREYLVTSPAELCAEPYENDIDLVPLPLKPSTASMRVGIDQSENTPPRTKWLPLTRALDWTKSNPKQEPERTGPELLNEFMVLLLGKSASDVPKVPR